MALADITNGGKKDYTVAFRIDEKYAPLIKRGVRLDLQNNSQKDFTAKRSQGATNMDLWTTGVIYPKDPRTGLPPEFNCLKDLVIFICKGATGLLGYAQSLARYETIASHSKTEVSRLMEMNHGLEEFNTLMLQRLEVLQKEVEDLQQINRMSEKAHYQAMQNKEKEVQMWKTKYERQLKDPFRLKRKDAFELSWSSGNGKKLKRLYRELTQAKTTKSTLVTNATFGTTQHYGGDQQTQRDNATVVAKMLTRTEKQCVIQQPGMKEALDLVTNETLQQVGQQVTPHDILAVCDQQGVSQAGYSQIRKTVRKGFKEINPSLKLSSLPNPHQVATLRRELNKNLEKYVGKWFYLSGELPDSQITKKSKSGDGCIPKSIHLGPENSFIADLRQVQRSMVRFYKVTHQELNGKPLIFVLKLDEAELVRNQKYERVAIILMNRALDPTITIEDPRYFSVQADENCWPVLQCEVSKESHSQLKWIFDQSKFPEVIHAQGNGELLTVHGMGDYLVEWHLGADMKSIKCMYGYKHGANAKYSCIYCLQERTKKEIVRNESAASLITKKRLQHGWQGGLFSDLSIDGDPSRGSPEDTDYAPILPIPLSRVHICTLHANVRISEKILHLHFMAVWNNQDKAAQAKAIQDIEASLSKAGVHKGKMRIFKDSKHSGASGSVPNKPSLNGRHVAALFERSKMTGNEKVWMDICKADRNLSNPQQNTIRLKMWKAYEAIQPYLKGLTLTHEEASTFSSKVKTWGKLFIEAFGEEHVTHYMHVLIRHAPWFVHKYGSLGVWSSQGMEKSHSTAKTTYSKHTQHGGGKKRKSACEQGMEWWYRCLQHRKRFQGLNETDLEDWDESVLDHLFSENEMA